MRSIFIKLCFILLLAVGGCQPSIDKETKAPSPSSFLITPLTVTVLSSTSELVQTEIPINTAIPPTPESPPGIQSITPQAEAAMPIFVEIIQTSALGGKTVESPIFGVGPSRYFYNPDNRILMLDSIITLEPKTEVLVGIKSILETSNEVFEKREVLQFPPAQPTLFQILSLDEDSGILSLTYEDKTFELFPGQSRSFKQTGNDANTSITVVVVSNYGHLNSIEPISSNGTQR